MGDASTLAERITIQDDATFPIIVAANDLRIRIPAGFTMTWDTTVTAVTLSGTASGKVSSTVTYEDSGRTAVLDVTTDFAALDELRVDDLRFTDFAAPSASDNLELEVGNDGIVSSIDNTTVDISPGGTANILSAFDQVFTYSGAPTGAAKITISDSSSGDIKKKKEIRIRIPLSFAMTWDTSISTLTLDGNAVGKVDSTVKAYEDGGKTLVLDVTTDFSAGDYVTISGAQFANFAANSGPDTLELEVRNDGSVTDTDDKTITIVGGPAAAISSASSQSFTVGAAPTVAATITITDSVDSGTITKADDVRIRIPAGFNMVWDTSVTTISLGGPAAGKVKSNLKAYEDAGKTAVIDISNNFAASDQFTIDGLQFVDFAAPSALAYLELEVLNDGGTTNTDDKTLTIVAGGTANILSAADQFFAVDADGAHHDFRRRAAHDNDGERSPDPHPCGVGDDLGHGRHDGHSRWACCREGVHHGQLRGRRPNAGAGRHRRFLGRRVHHRLRPEIHQFHRLQHGQPGARGAQRRCGHGHG